MKGKRVYDETPGAAGKGGMGILLKFPLPKVRSMVFSRLYQK